MLSLLLVLPALFQDPILELDPLLQQAYYQALHQLEVEGAVQSAAHNFASLALTPGLRDKPGQRALVLAQAYRAHLLLGESEQAKEYLVEAQRLSNGGSFESRVLAIVEQTLAARPPGQDIDREFYVLVREALMRGDGDNEDVLRRYGRRALPYYAEFLREVDLGGNLGAAARSSSMRVVARLGLRQANADFMRACAEVFADQDAVFLEGFLAKGIDLPPVDDEAAAALDAYLVALSLDADVRRARLGGAFGARILRGRRSAALEKRLGDILSSHDDLLAPFVVEELGWSGTNVFNPDGEDLPLFASGLAGIAMRSPQPEVSQVALERTWQANRPELLLEFAQERGARIDRLRHLSSLLPIPQGRSRQAQGGRRNTNDESFAVGDARKLFDVLRAEISKELGYSIERMPTRSRPLTGAELPIVRDHAASSDPMLALIAAGAAVSELDVETLSSALARRDLPHVDALLQALPPSMPAELVPAVKPWLADAEHAQVAAVVLSASAQHLAVEDWLRVDALLSGDAREDLVGAMSHLSTSEDGLARLVQLSERDSASWTTRRNAVLFAIVGKPLAVTAALAWPEAEFIYVARQLLGKWAPAAAKEAARQGRLDAVSRAGFTRLLAYVCGHNLGRGELSKELGVMLDAGVDGALELVVEAIAEGDSPENVVSVLLQAIDNQRDHEQAWRAKVYRVVMKRDPVLAARNMSNFLGRSYTVAGIEGVVSAMLVSTNPSLRSGALRILDSHHELVERYHDFLIPLLHDGEFAARAAELMVAHSSRDDVADWLETAWNLPALRSRDKLLLSMGRLQDERLVPILLEALADPDDKVSAAATIALERMRAVREQRETWEAWRAQGSTLGPVTALMKKVRSDNREVRIAAVRSLGVMEAREALPALVDLLESEDPGMVEAAREALQAIHAAARRERGVSEESEVPVETTEEVPVEKEAADGGQ